MGARSLPAGAREREPLRVTRGSYGFERISNKTLRAADRAGDIEAAIEAPQVLRGLERLFER